MLSTIRFFFSAKQANPAVVVLCTLLASLSEMVGLGTLLPVISLAAGIESPAAEKMGDYIASVLSLFGIPFSLGPLVVLVAVFFTLKALLTFAAMAYASRAAAAVSLSIRQRLIAAVFGARWGYFSDQRSGSLANIVGTEASRAGEAYVNAANIVSFSLQAVVYAVLAMLINWKLAVFSVIVGVLFALLLRGFIKSSRRAGFKHTNSMKSVLNELVDAMTNIKPLKSMHRYEATLQSVNRNLERLKKAFLVKELSRAGLQQTGTTLIALIMVTGIYIAHSVLRVPFAELLVSAFVFNQIITVASKLQRQIQLSAGFESAYVSANALIDEAEAARETASGTVQPQADAPCRFEHVDFAYGEREVLNDVSLTIPGGGITVLSGPSGSGKTTIVDLLIGFHRPKSGRIHIGETPLEEIDIRAWRRGIGYVPQELSLFHSSIRNNLTLGDPAITEEMLQRAIDLAGARDFISALPQGLDTDVGQMGSKFSGGQRQRISLARALAGAPRLLILDEVTSALDPLIEREIVQNIATLKGHFTILAITHRPAWTDIADVHYRVEDGRVSPA